MYHDTPPKYMYVSRKRPANLETIRRNNQKSILPRKTKSSKIPELKTAPYAPRRGCVQIGYAPRSYIRNFQNRCTRRVPLFYIEGTRRVVPCPAPTFLFDRTNRFLTIIDVLSLLNMNVMLMITLINCVYDL